MYTGLSLLEVLLQVVIECNLRKKGVLGLISLKSSYPAPLSF